MSWTAIAVSAACLVVSFVVIFMLAGAIAPGPSASTLGQLVLAGIASLVGLLAGNAVYTKYFPGR